MRKPRDYKVSEPGDGPGALYQVRDCPWTVPELNKELIGWEFIYNCVRPHHCLDEKTPLQFLKDQGIANVDCIL
jgi:hypothetical protein